MWCIEFVFVLFLSLWNQTVNLLGVLQEEFEEYAQKAKTLPQNTTNENLLILYGLYKQGTVGPVNTSKYFAAQLYENILCHILY